MQRRPTVGPGSQKAPFRVTLVTLVSHSQPLWRGVTQGRVNPCLLSGRAPNCERLFGVLGGLCWKLVLFQLKFFEGAVAKAEG